jgi:hypothetical protein
MPITLSPQVKISTVKICAQQVNKQRETVAKVLQKFSCHDNVLQIKFSRNYLVVYSSDHMNAML